MKKLMILSGSIISIFLLALIACSSSEERAPKLLDPVETAVTGKQGGSEESSIKNNTVNAKSAAYIRSSRELMDAYKGEVTASAKYAAQSRQAEQEGYLSIALLFKAAAAAEMIHAGNHKAVMEESGIKIPSFKPVFTVKSTSNNLEEAIKGESYEFTTMYPLYLKNEEKAGNHLAVISLTYAWKTEQKHLVMFTNVLAAIVNGTSKSLPLVYHICPNCGNTLDKDPMIRCDICLTISERFIKISSLKSQAE